MQPVRLWEGVPVPPGDLAGGQGGGVGLGRLLCPAGAGLHPVPHPGGGSLLQRARYLLPALQTRHPSLSCFLDNM